MTGADTINAALHTVLIVVTTGMLHGLYRLIAAVIQLDKRVSMIEDHLKLGGKNT